jgi:hypothetical protein
MISKLNKLNEIGLVEKQSHPSLPLIIWNYTRKVQYGDLWSHDPLLVECRGLITDYDGKIIARPLKKFWNIEENTVIGDALASDIDTTSYDGDIRGLNGEYSLKGVVYEFKETGSLSTDFLAFTSTTDPSLHHVWCFCKFGNNQAILMDYFGPA